MANVFINVFKRFYLFVSRFYVFERFLKFFWNVFTLLHLTTLINIFGLLLLGL